MSYYLKYTEEGREAMWYVGHSVGWKSASYLMKTSNRLKPKHLPSHSVVQRLITTHQGLMSGEFESVEAQNDSMLAEAVRDSLNGECIFPACQGADPDPKRGYYDGIPQPLMAIAYGKGRGGRDMFMRRSNIGGEKTWLSMRELREAGDLPKQFRDAESVKKVENSERNRHVDTGGHYHGVVTQDMAGMTWEGTAKSLAGALNDIADATFSGGATKSSLTTFINDLRRQAGEMLDVLQMRNEDEDD